jgi:hypothetical protein
MVVITEMKETLFIPLSNIECKEHQRHIIVPKHQASKKK